MCIHICILVKWKAVLQSLLQNFKMLSVVKEQAVGAYQAWWDTFFQWYGSVLNVLFKEAAIIFECQWNLIMMPISYQSFLSANIREFLQISVST